MDAAKLCKIFEEEVLSRFSFLAKEYSFGEPSVENYGSSVWIVYRSSAVYVKFVYGGIGREITMTFGRVGIDDRADRMDFYHNDIRQRVPSENEKFDFMAFNERAVVLCVEKLANLMQRFGQPYLSCDDSAYELLLELKKARISDWQNKMKVKDAKKAADSAWQKKNYEEVIEALNPVRELLNRVDLKKLEYATKHT